MPINRHTAEQIIRKLRKAEVAISQGKPIALVAKDLEITEQTYYRWRKEYGGLKVDQSMRVEQLEKENGQLKRIIADQALDMAILR